MASRSSSSFAGHAERGVHTALLEAAASADDHALSLALQLATNADVNATDPSGRTLVGAVLAGESWEDADASDASFKLEKRLSMLKILLGHGGLSLYSLNAPQDALKGATPLSFASWLNLPDVVRLLLVEYPGVVTVDGMDSRGATPLMYAARDGSTEVVQCLLEHGARPDYRDVHDRTSVQYCLRHPDVLWLCESALRRHRAREYVTRGNSRHLCHLYPELDESLAAQPITCHPRLVSPISRQDLLHKTAVLVSAVLSQDIHQLDFLLFPAVTPENSISTPPSDYPYLINYPDEQGWSPIHHCVTAINPSFVALDILYRAGADTSLYTLSGHGTALHCLAYKADATTTSSIRPFIHHLVDDLRAPLSAVDQEGETCIHVAAEHGQSYEVLVALLSCDVTGSVRAMRNSRGLTAMEVAQDRFKIAFGGADHPRSASSASMRTIRPSTSSSESASSLVAAPRVSLPPRLNVDHEALSLKVLDNLLSISHEVVSSAGDLDVSAAEDLLRQTSSMGHDLLSQMQFRLRDVVAEVGGARKKYAQVDALIDTSSRALGMQLGQQWERTYGDALARSITGHSVSSESTKVSCESSYRTAYSENGSTVSVPKATATTKVDIGISAVPQYGSQVDIICEVEEDDPFAGPLSNTSPSTPSHSSFYKSLRPVKSMTDIRQQEPAEERRFLGIVSPWAKSLPRKRSKSDLTSNRPPTSKWGGQTTTLEESVKSGTARIRAWFKKKILHDSDPKITYITSIDEESCPVGREVKRRDVLNFVRPRSSSLARQMGRPMNPACRVIAIARRDMASIRESLDSADRYIQNATRSIEQASRSLTSAIEERESSLDTARFIQDHLVDSEVGPSFEISDELSEESVEFPPVTIPSSARNSQLVFPRPPNSPTSTMSYASTLIEDPEDDDMRSLRKLLTRKINAQIEQVFAEVEKAETWLRITRDVTRSVRRRDEL